MVTVVGWVDMTEQWWAFAGGTGRWRGWLAVAWRGGRGITSGGETGSSNTQQHGRADITASTPFWRFIHCLNPMPATCVPDLLP